MNAQEYLEHWKQGEEATPKEPVYDKRSRFPRQLEKGKCRGCHGPVPKGRRTWCSPDCCQKFEPRRVRFAVWKRDEGKCQLCLVVIADPQMPWRKIWHCDHIVPFAKGGLTIIENMRVLCVSCHKARHGKKTTH